MSIFIISPFLKRNTGIEYYTQLLENVGISKLRGGHFQGMKLKV